MSTIQNLIETFYQTTEKSNTVAEEQAAAVLEAVKKQDTLLVAYFPRTKHYYITKEFGQQCAIIFSKRDIFERFAVVCKERGVHIAAIENPVSDRMFLFADLWRCGFTRIMVDYQPLYLNLALTDFFQIPNYTALPLAQRPVISPRMTGKLLYLMQEIHSGRADGGQELDVLTELYHTPFLMPAEHLPDGTVRIPVQTVSDGRRMGMLFTDRREWTKVIQDQKLTPEIAWFKDMQQKIEKDWDIVVINPNSGAELILDAQLLETAEKVATGNTTDLKLHSLREGERVTVTEPERIPENLTERITACLHNHPEIKTAWLQLMKKDSTLLPNYLLILESTEEKDLTPLYREIAETALPASEGLHLECISYEKELAKYWVGKAKPFYHKKRFGFLK